MQYFTIVLYQNIMEHYILSSIYLILTQWKKEMQIKLNLLMMPSQLLLSFTITVYGLVRVTDFQYIAIVEHKMLI